MEKNGIVRLLEIAMDEADNLCSTFYRIALIFEYHEDTL
jgi:hypothetical protein